MKIWVLMLGLMLVTGAVRAGDDSPAARAAQAERYLKAAPPEDMMKDMAEKMSGMVPPAQRETFVAMMTKDLDVPALRASMKDAMVKTFTADELSALADFYSTPLGKSAMKKMGTYMQACMPILSAEMKKAMDKASAAMAAKANATPAATAEAPAKKQ